MSSEAEIISCLSNFFNNIDQDDEVEVAQDEFNDADTDVSDVASDISVTAQDMPDFDENNTSNEHRSIEAWIESNAGIPLSMGLIDSEIADNGIVVSGKRGNRVLVDEIREHFMIPEYPETKTSHEERTPVGVLHFIHVSNPIPQEVPTPQDINNGFMQIASEIQFSMQNRTGFNSTTVPLLARADAPQDETCQAWHKSYNCTSVRSCTKRAPTVIQAKDEYNNVHPSLFQSMRRRSGKQHKPQALLALDEACRQRTLRYYHAITQDWGRYRQVAPCLHPETKQRTCVSEAPSIWTNHSSPYTFIGCPKISANELWHVAHSVNTETHGLDKDYLHYLVKGGDKPITNHCEFVLPSSSRQVYCDYDHVDGAGLMEQLDRNGCHSKFDIYIPHHYARFPFVILVTRGRHAHPPPPPRKTPKAIADQIKSILEQRDCLDLTTRRFLISPEFRALYERNKNEVPALLHPSLNLQDRITALVRKQKLFQYPEGTHLAGVLREYRFDKEKTHNQWIRDVYFFDEEKTQYLIICCTDAQAQEFHNARTLEMDLSFKMVAGQTSVFSISAWNETIQRIHTYIYAFTNVDTRWGYAVMFEKLFQVIHNVSRRPVRFPHIHGGDHGIRAITVDMCLKQAPGLGDYLHKLDPSRHWQEHLLYLLVFCRVHVLRNFMKKFGRNHPAKHALENIWNARSYDEVMIKMESLKNIYPEDTKLHHWLDRKQKAWILGGLCPGVSKIPILWWDMARKHTGLSESSHFQDNNVTGRKNNLLAAVLKLKQHSEYVFSSYRQYLQTSIPDKSGSRGNIQRIRRNQKRINTRKQRQAIYRANHPAIPPNPHNPWDIAARPLPPQFDNDDNSSVQTATPAREHLQFPLTAAWHMHRAGSVPTVGMRISSPAPTESTLSANPTQSQALFRGRLHEWEESIDPGEVAHQERMKQMQARIRGLEQQKEEKEMRARLQALEEELATT